MNWGSARQFVTSSTGRLAASYLLIIMGMSLGYSLVLYTTSARELQRQIPPTQIMQHYRGNGTPDDEGGTVIVTPQPVQDFFADRAAEARHTVLIRLVLLNVLTLVAGAGLSYYLARRSLLPIEQNMEAQSQFVSDASHELRTPLTTLLTSNEVALRNPKLTLANSRKLIEQNVDEIIKLQALTDSLLALARHDGGQPVLQDVALQDIVSDAINSVLPVAQARDVVVEDAIKPATVLGDRQTLAQSLVIILENAIKYGPAKSTIHIEGGKRGKRAFVAVRDEGPGIRPYDLRRIFDRFYRADQSRSAQHVPGHGIGLSLAKKLLEQQGADIRAASTVGKGSTFTIGMPMANESNDKK